MVPQGPPIFCLTQSQLLAWNLTKSIRLAWPDSFRKPPVSTSCILMSRIKIEGMGAPGFPVVPRSQFTFLCLQGKYFIDQDISSTKIPPDMAERLAIAMDES